MSEPIIVFNHVPKTAGTSLLGLFRSSGASMAWLGPARIGPDYNENLEAEVLKSVACGARIIHGHFPFGIHECLERPAVNVTVLRDPVERAYSFYRFLRQGQHNNAGNRYKHLPFADFVEQFNWVSDGAVRQLSGRGYHDQYEVTEEIYEEALANLRSMDLVGVTEDLTPFCHKLCDLLQMPQRVCGHNNRTIKHLDLTEDAVQRAKEANKWDYLLYRQCKGAC